LAQISWLKKHTFFILAQIGDALEDCQTAVGQFLKGRNLKFGFCTSRKIFNYNLMMSE
jgi:hypothetical protein